MLRQRNTAIKISNTTPKTLSLDEIRRAGSAKEEKEVSDTILIVNEPPSAEKWKPSFGKSGFSIT